MLHCVQNVVNAWSEVTKDTAANAWNKLQSYDEPEGEDDHSLAELDNLIKLGNEAGLTLTGRQWQVTIVNGNLDAGQKTWAELLENWR